MNIYILPSFVFTAGLSMPKEQWDMMVKDALQKVEDVKQKYTAFLKEKNVIQKYN